MQSSEDLSYATILKKAWPIILANASVPLLGLVDTAVIGNYGATIDLGAIAFGALIFSFVYWGFGFLRMSTTGFAAQAKGAGDNAEVRAVLGRALVLAMLIGVSLVLLQIPIQLIAFTLLEGSEEVEVLAKTYFSIRIWGAPATLATFALMGVIVGLGKSRQLLYVQVFLNGLNIILDIWFAGVLGLGAAGVALGTVIAEFTTVIFASFLVIRSLRSGKPEREVFWNRSSILDKRLLLRTLSSNFNIMVRTLLLVFSFAYFTNQSAQFGDEVLAANHILLQIVAFAAFFLDGFAFVAEALVGQAVGAKLISRFDLSVRRTSVLALLTAILLAVLVLFLGEGFISLLTDIFIVKDSALENLSLIAIYIALSVAAFQLDGVFIGAALTREMRNAAIISIIVYLVAITVLLGEYGNTGLWMAMIVYVIVRALSLLVYYPQLRKSLRV